MSIPWIEKYRPQTIDEVVSHKTVLTTLQKFMSTGILPHMIFYGPPGSGKTSTILACTRKLYGDQQKFMTFELNASNDRGINVVRNIVRDFASTKRAMKGYAVIILDEADSLTIDAQYALRSIMDSYIENTVFCLICNYISKIIQPIISRCTRFHFNAIQPKHIKSFTAMIAKTENLTLQDGSQDLIVRLCKGDLRMAINLMQSTSMAYGSTLSSENIMKCFGIPTDANLKTTFEISTDSDSNLSDTYLALHAYIEEEQLIIGDLLDNIFERTILNEKLPNKFYSHLCQIKNNWMKTKNYYISIVRLIILLQRFREHFLKD